MRKRKRYIEFQEQEPLPGRKTRRMKVVNTSGIELGMIYWWPNWRQYTFSPGKATIYNEGCLDEIHAKVVQMNEEHRLPQVQDKLP